MKSTRLPKQTEDIIIYISVDALTDVYSVGEQKTHYAMDKFVRIKTTPSKFNLSDEAASTFEKFHDQFEDIIHEKSHTNFVSGNI